MVQKKAAWRCCQSRQPSKFQIYDALRQNFPRAYGECRDDQLDPLANSFLDLSYKERNICLEIEPRIYTNLILLRFMIAFIAFWLWFRYSVRDLEYVQQDFRLTQYFSIFLSGLAILFNILDLQLMKLMTRPGLYIWVSVIIKTLKACLTAVMFLANNTANDFTIGLVFLITSWLGWWYFHNNRVNRPRDFNHDLALCDDSRSKIIAME